MVVKCPESKRATGLTAPPRRRVRCMVCDSLVKLKVDGQFGIVYVQPHNVPRMGPRSATELLKRGRS